MTKIQIPTVLASFVSLVTFAEPIQWLPAGPGDYDWMDPSNWSGETVPSGETAQAVFADSATDQTITLISAEEPTMSVDSVSGGTASTVIKTRACEGWGFKNLFFSIRDPNGFLGRWAAGNPSTTFELRAGADFVPRLNVLSAQNHPFVRVPSDKAKVGVIADGGEVEKTGAGALEVESVGDVDTHARLDTRLRLSEGTLILDGRDDAACYHPVAGAYFHVDASRPDTMTIVKDEQGRNRVTEWRDADGGAITAVPREGGIPAPVLRADGLVDFGCRWHVDEGAPDEELYGPAAVLDFPRTVDARAVFYVYALNKADYFEYAVLGDSETFALVNRINPPTDYIAISWMQPEAYYGTIVVDGLRRDPWYTQDWTKLSVMNLNLTGSVPVSNFGAYQHYRRGGFRLAEVLIYTNELTAAERAINNRYLQAKWQGGLCPDWDVACVSVDAADGVLNVPAGRTFKTGVLQTSTGKIVKEGEGTLLFERLEPASADIDVREGRATFFTSSAAANAGKEPAADPLLWLDASNAGSFAMDGENITQWKDCRTGTDGRSYGSAVADSSEPNRPTRKVDDSGLACVDFGCGYYADKETDKGDSSSLLLQGATGQTPNGYEAFVVLRMKWAAGSSGREIVPFFGCKVSMAFSRYGDTTGRGLSTYASGVSYGAEWTCDGVTFNPYACCDFGTESFHVIRVSLSQQLDFDSIAADYNNWILGGVEVAEQLVYARPLTVQERRDTEAYLMQKWLDKAHPESADARAARGVKTLMVPDDKAVIFDSDADFSVARLVGGNGTYVKSGAGATTVIGELDALKARSIAVNGGSLTLGLGWNDDSIYHFDATKAATLKTNGADVLSWSSANGNGAVADSFVASAAVAYPQLRTEAVREGIERPIVDFGHYSTTDSAAMTITASEDAEKVIEYYAVRSDPSETVDFSGLDLVTDSDWHNYYTRYSTGGFFYPGAWQQPFWDAVQNSAYRLDGETAHPWETQVTDCRYHMFEILWSEGVPIRSIAAVQGGLGAGGAKYGEIIAFAQTNAPTVQAYLRQSLMHKWFGVGEKPRFTSALDALTVSGGGSFALANDAVLTARQLGGAGVMTFGSVTDVRELTVGGAAGEIGELTVNGDMTLAEGAEMSFDLQSAESCDALIVNGTLTLPATATVSLSLSQVKKLRRGRYTLMTATTLAGAEGVKDWTVALDAGLERSGGVVLVVEDNVIFAECRGNGMAVFVR